MKYGFVKVAAAVPHVQVADCSYNSVQIEKARKRALSRGVFALFFYD